MADRCVDGIQQTVNPTAAKFQIDKHFCSIG
jgi:hypothetical protein